MAAGQHLVPVRLVFLHLFHEIQAESPRYQFNIMNSSFAPDLPQTRANMAFERRTQNHISLACTECVRESLTRISRTFLNEILIDVKFRNSSCNFLLVMLGMIEEGVVLAEWWRYATNFDCR